jgi:hypothetical protein
MQPNQQNTTPPAAKPGEAILNRILEANGQAAPSPNGQEPIVDKTATKEFEVDIGNGVKRRVPMDDLVKTYLRKNEVDSTKEALEKRFAEIGDLQSVRALQKRIESLDGARQRKVLAILQGEDDSEPEDGDEIDRTIDKGSPRSREAAPPDDGLQQRFDTLENAVRALAARENGRLQTERKQTISERVDALMKQFPIFSEEKNDAAIAFAKKSIMTQVLTGQGADLEGVVQEAAAELQAFKHRAQDAVREEVGVPRRLEGVPKGGLKGGDLKSGKVRALAASLLGRVAR